MRRIHLLCTALLALIVTNATADEGVSLRWSNCLGDGGTLNRNFACNTNTGAHVLIGSFELGSDMSPVSGLEVRIDLQAAAPSLPAWWGFKNAGTCRMTSLSLNVTIPGTAVSCLDWADAQATGGLAAYNVGTFGPAWARIIAASAVPQSALATLGPGQEYFAFNLVISNAKTVGAGACAGCFTPVNLYFNSLKVTTPTFENDRTLANPLNGQDSNLATWQGGFPIATRRETWGAVKALYR